MNLFNDTFLSSANQYPNNIALVTTEHGQVLKFTYQKLLRISTLWSQYLNRLNPTKAPIAIYGRKKWQMYGAILASLQSKAAYVPLNNKQAVAKNMAILQQILCSVLLVAEGANPCDLLVMNDDKLTVIYLGQDNPQWLHKLCHSMLHDAIR